MNKRFYYILWVFALALLWCVLFLDFTYIKIAKAIGMSIFCIIVTEKFILKKSLIDIFPIHLLNLTMYFFVLVFYIFKNSLAGIKSIFTGDMDFDFITIKTILHDDYSRVLLANSITLQSGTITVDVEEDELLILWMNPKTEDPEVARKLISSPLENILKGG